MYRLISVLFCIAAMSSAGEALGQAREPNPVVEILEVKIAPTELNPGDHARLSWSTRYAVSCAFDPPLEGIDNLHPTGTALIEPSQTTEYKLTCSGEGGPTSKPVSVVVQPPARVFSVSATPPTVTQGEPSTIAWKSEQARNCLFNPGGHEVATEGSREVRPEATGTYSVTCKGVGPAMTGHTVVTVGHVEAELTATPHEDIEPGTTVTLQWSSQYAKADCTLTPPGKPVGPSGREEVVVEHSTTYEISCPGAAGPAIAMAAVTVARLQILDFSAKPNPTPGPDAPITLAWRTRAARYCDIEGRIGSVPVNGEWPLDPGPPTNTGYRLVCGGLPGSGTVGRYISVDVIGGLLITEFSAPAEQDVMIDAEIRYKVVNAAKDGCVFRHGDKPPITLPNSEGSIKQPVWLGPNRFTLDCKGAFGGSAHASALTMGYH